MVNMVVECQLRACIFDPLQIFDTRLHMHSVPAKPRAHCSVQMLLRQTAPLCTNIINADISG